MRTNNHHLRHPPQRRGQPWPAPGALVWRCSGGGGTLLSCPAAARPAVPPDRRGHSRRGAADGRAPGRVRRGPKAASERRWRPRGGGHGHAARLSSPGRSRGRLPCPVVPHPAARALGAAQGYRCIVASPQTGVCVVRRAGPVTQPGVTLEHHSSRTGDWAGFEVLFRLSFDYVFRSVRRPAYLLKAAAGSSDSSSAYSASTPPPSSAMLRSASRSTMTQ